jgi:hypothetical protein
VPRPLMIKRLRMNVTGTVQAITSSDAIILYR